MNNILNNFNFTNPICFFDLETTGLTINEDKIIEIYIKKINTDRTTEEFYSKINPEGKEIRLEAFGKHGIKLEDLENEPTFKEIATDVLDFISGCDLGGYNIVEFDIPLLMTEFDRVGINYNFRKVKIFDSKIIYWKMEPRTLEGAYYSFTGKQMENAHQASSDVNATIEIFEKQLEKYQLEPTPETIHNISIDSNFIDFSRKFEYDENRNIIITFGKYKGETVTDIYEYDPNYFNWILNSDFSLDTKKIVKKILKTLKNE